MLVTLLLHYVQMFVLKFTHQCSLADRLKLIRLVLFCILFDYCVKTLQIIKLWKHVLKLVFFCIQNI